jgi:hypothetical protein
LIETELPEAGDETADLGGWIALDHPQAMDLDVLTGGKVAFLVLLLVHASDLWEALTGDQLKPHPRR